jgi:mannan endo-1,4-beta-mannosidase
MRKNIFLSFCLMVLLASGLYAQGFQYFITAKGNRLMDGDLEYRFLSFNAPNLNFIEDEMSFTVPHPYRLPTEYEIRDVLLTIKQIGGRVVRIYTIPVKRADEPADVPASVLGPGKFNEDAFKANDLMLSIANELGIRIIFPIVNNWKWMGGRPQYAAFRGKNEDDFWTDPQLIADVENTINYTLNRKNTITGVQYKDDKAILCWETGNELHSPISWTIEIAKYIKSIDKNHLVMDGNSRPVSEELLDEPSVDIFTTHHYETDPQKTIENMEKNIQTISGKKPYIIGEFGFQSTSALNFVMEWMIAQKEISGALIWGLRGHREEGGFYWHSEPFGRGIYKAYHWTGFTSGNSYDEINFMPVLRENAFIIQGKPIPAIEKPEPPVLPEIKNVWDINWKGSVGASYYNVERSDADNGPWKVIARNINDAEFPYFPLYHDQNAVLGKSYYYRIIAGNISGESAPSNAIGPVLFNSQALIDNMSDFGTLFYSERVDLATGNDRSFKEDLNRLAGKDSSVIIYYIPGNFISAKIFSFEPTDISALSFEGSLDNKDYHKIEVKTYNAIEGKNDYGYWNPVLYETDPNVKNLKYIKIVFTGAAQIARVEIIFH